MNNYQTTQQTKLDPKGKAISSLVLGIISIPLGIFFGIIGSGLPALLGLIFGTMGVKSTKKTIAVMGIILCIAGLGIGIYWVLFITSTF